MISFTSVKSLIQVVLLEHFPVCSYCVLYVVQYFTLLYFNHFLKNIHIVRSRGEDQKQEQVPLQMVTQILTRGYAVQNKDTLNY